jgi:hypothetical protein
VFENNPDATKNKNNLKIKNYEKDFTFLVFVANSNKLRNAKNNDFPCGECSRVLQW